MTPHSHPRTTIHAVDRATCPHCWHRFQVHEVLAVARHTSLRSPSVVEGALRFRPSRFTDSGNPIDPMGEECRELACPRCYLVIGRSTLDTLPLFASIVGAPASGKSYFLASATWTIRHTLPKFGWSITDASPTDNAIIQANEQRLFLAAEPDRPVMLAKTDQSGGELYSRVDIRGQSEVLLRPFQFLLTPMAGSHDYESRKRLMVLYDNAGEHFLPGSSMGIDATRHLSHSKVIMFLLDPTQDPRMRTVCRSSDPQVTKGPRGIGFAETGVRQELILGEMAHRVRTLRNARPSDPINAALIVILAKADLHEPLGQILRSHTPVRTAASHTTLDTRLIRDVSAQCRAFIHSCCPEFVSCAESTAKQVLFVPISALGCSPEETVTPDGSVFFGIRPDRVHPLWVDVPFLIALQSLDPKSFPDHPGSDRNRSAQEKGVQA